MRVGLINGVGSTDGGNIESAVGRGSGVERVMLGKALGIGWLWILCRGNKGELRTVFQGVSKMPSIALLGWIEPGSGGLLGRNIGLSVAVRCDCR